MSEIGVNAFDGCVNLVDLTIPNSVTHLRKGAFRGCSSLTSVTIPDSVIHLGGWAFYSCRGLTNAVIGNGVTEIGEVSVSISNSVVRVGTFAFNACTNLARITISNSILSLGENSFAYCLGLKGIYFEGHAPWAYGGNIFGNATPVTVYYLPSNGGWGATYAGRPTALWPFLKPLILLATNTLVSGWTYFSDPEWMNHPVRIYRARQP